MNFAKCLDDFKSKLKTIPAGERRVHALRASAPALFLEFYRSDPEFASLFSPDRKNFLAALPTEEEALKLIKDINFFSQLLGRGEEEIFFLPEPDGPEISGKRAMLPHKISEGSMPDVIASKTALLAPLWPESHIRELVLSLERKKEFPREGLEERLLALGYVPVHLVTAPGQFRLKEWLLDVFPVTSEEPLRVEFFGDEVEHIRKFELDTQLTTDEVDSLTLLPAREPLKGEFTEFDYFRMFSIEDALGEEILPDAFHLSRNPLKGEGFDAGVLSLAGYGVLKDERRDITELPLAIKRLKGMGDILIVLGSPAQGERVKEILAEEDITAPVLKPEEAGTYPGNVAILTGGLSSGFYLPGESGEAGLFVITARELFGEKPAWKTMKKSKLSGLLENLDDLTHGDYVVHKDHGIGKFLGFVKESFDGFSSDMMLLEYGEGTKLYLPLYRIDRITKYRSPEGRKPQLDNLGGKAWEKRKTRVKKRLKEMAGPLLEIYAARQVAKGFTFSPDTDLHREFDSFFPYEETPDQARAIDEVKKDMESIKPMERLLCGDVGYGKTEVAMRAAFKAVYDHKQVVILVPTTLLCEQHFRTFSKRFAPFPVKIDYLSRFKSISEKKVTLQAFEKGETDILIGTHALLRADLSFRNLGLLIVDEEHRFGVAHKERIKELRKNLDVLLLTATPIPRTLQMALSGIRDMSVIETPPEDRLAVKTVVSVFNKSLIKEAVEKELSRGGQIFIVHNRIEDIEKLGIIIRDLLPQARVGIAHGRVNEKTLEHTMLKFLDGELDILLSTAIIGSGLDIPTANTIIIDRADMMGLADLYQLKGRVGRSDRRAYAYFLVPGYDIITDDARKRLAALEELSYLGAGFRVAMKDLEIRGAGNLLGAEQSGYINDIGFDMYLELLERAVAELKGEEVRVKEKPSVELQVAALIPETYMEDISIRLSFYRRIASAESGGEIKNIARELEERFGPIPEETKNLLNIMSLRIASEEADLASLRQINGKIRFEFREGVQLPVQELVKAFGGNLKFIPDRLGFDLYGYKEGVLKESLSVLRHLTQKYDFVIV